MGLPARNFDSLQVKNAIPPAFAEYVVPQLVAQRLSQLYGFEVVSKNGTEENPEAGAALTAMLSGIGLPTLGGHEGGIRSALQTPPPLDETSRPQPGRGN